MNISFLKKDYGAEIEGKKKKKSGKLICGNGIAEIEGKKKVTNWFVAIALPK